MVEGAGGFRQGVPPGCGMPEAVGLTGCSGVVVEVCLGKIPLVDAGCVGHALLVIVGQSLLEPAGGPDVQIVEGCPQGLQNGVLVDVVRRLADPEELPATPLEVALPGQVPLVLFGTVPRVAIAFDRQAAFGS